MSLLTKFVCFFLFKASSLIRIMLKDIILVVCSKLFDNLLLIILLRMRIITATI